MGKPDIHDKIALFINGGLHGFQQGAVRHVVFLLVVKGRYVNRVVNILFSVDGDTQPVPQQVEMCIRDSSG